MCTNAQSVLLCVDQNWWSGRGHTPCSLSLLLYTVLQDACVELRKGLYPGKVKVGKWLLLLTLRSVNQKRRKTEDFIKLFREQVL